MTNMLKTLVIASEKAANVARSCVNSTSCSLLIVEKGENEANIRFEKDFKTIADVLAQESAKVVISRDFPEIADDLRGEESATIDGVTVSLQNTAEETAELLKLLVPMETATKMAQAAHCNIASDIYENLPDNLPNINPSELGIWIDPIDATAEFIAGVKGDADASDRLVNVTVLIGAYLKSTGEPVLGVINQPFYDNGKGRILWGMTYNKTNVWSECDNVTEVKIILMSGSEKPEIVEKFINAGWQVQAVPGAGNKLMKVALGEAAAYLVSQGTTFCWDTCAPHSIIRAKDGDIVDFHSALPLTYNLEKGLDSVEYCNKNGIIAYKNKTVLDEIKNLLNIA